MRRLSTEPEETTTKQERRIPMKAVKKIEALLAEYYETFKH
ncbi:MAG: hypothetical protein ACI3WQ_12100 [Faecousia sp.]